MTRARARVVAAEGAAAVELAAGIGLLVLPVTLLVLSFPVWVETQTTARIAAREATRAYLLADDDQGGLVAATQAAERIVATHRGELARPVRIDGTVAGRPGTQREIVATVTVRLPALPLPFLADLGTVEWTTSHAAPVDVYRSAP